MLFARGYGERSPAESRPLLAAFCEEYLNNWLFKAAASDAQHPRFVRDFMPAYRWHGNEVPGARTGGDNPDNCYRLAGIEHVRPQKHTFELQSLMRLPSAVRCLKIKHNTHDYYINISI